MQPHLPRCRAPGRWGGQGSRGAPPIHRAPRGGPLRCFYAHLLCNPSLSSCRRQVPRALEPLVRVLPHVAWPLIASAAPMAHGARIAAISCALMLCPCRARLSWRPCPMFLHRYVLHCLVPSASQHAMCCRSPCLRVLVWLAASALLPQRCPVVCAARLRSAQVQRRRWRARTSAARRIASAEVARTAAIAAATAPRSAASTSLVPASALPTLPRASAWPHAISTGGTWAPATAANIPPRSEGRLRQEQGPRLPKPSAAVRGAAGAARAVRLPWRPLRRTGAQSGSGQRLSGQYPQQRSQHWARPGA
jgi:hypothetical protein